MTDVGKNRRKRSRLVFLFLPVWKSIDFACPAIEPSEIDPHFLWGEDLGFFSEADEVGKELIVRRDEGIDVSFFLALNRSVMEDRPVHLFSARGQLYRHLDIIGLRIFDGGGGKASQFLLLFVCEAIGLLCQGDAFHLIEMIGIKLSIRVHPQDVVHSFFSGSLHDERIEGCSS